jgi:hypothetical protein
MATALWVWTGSSAAYASISVKWGVTYDVTLWDWILLSQNILQMLDIRQHANEVSRFVKHVEFPDQLRNYQWNQDRICTMAFHLFYSVVMPSPLTFMAQVGILYRHRRIYKGEWNIGDIVISLINPKYSERNLLQCQLVHHKSNMDCTSTEPWPVWCESP